VRLGLVSILAVLAAAALPQIASAHVGATLPVATDFTARITGFTPAAPGLAAKVVDGDQTLWLRAPASAVVAVPGILGEPLLRFDPRGVWLNLRSPTAQADRIDRFDLRPSANPNAPPLWHRLTSGHAYAWHEHRLHILEPLARGRGSAGTIGPWSVPLVAGGRRVRLKGVLDFRPPGPSWAWIALAVIAALGAAVSSLRSSTILVALAFVVTALTWALRIGRELYGRPGVPVVGDVEIALTCAVGLALLYGLVRRDESARVFTAFLVGFGGLYEGLTMLPVLTHSIALSALPSIFARPAVALVLGAGGGILAGSTFGHLRVRSPEPLREAASPQ